MDCRVTDEGLLPLFRMKKCCGYFIQAFMGVIAVVGFYQVSFPILYYPFFPKVAL